MAKRMLTREILIERYKYAKKQYEICGNSKNPIGERYWEGNKNCLLELLEDYSTISINKTMTEKELKNND